MRATSIASKSRRTDWEEVEVVTTLIQPADITCCPLKFSSQSSCLNDKYIESADLCGAYAHQVSEISAHQDQMWVSWPVMSMPCPINEVVLSVDSDIRHWHILHAQNVFPAD